MKTMAIALGAALLLSGAAFAQGGSSTTKSLVNGKASADVTGLTANTQYSYTVAFKDAGGTLWMSAFPSQGSVFISYIPTIPAKFGDAALATLEFRVTS